jgi:hypothetical protein
MPDLLTPDKETSVGTTEQEAIDLYNSTGKEDANSDATDGARCVINLEDVPGAIGTNPNSKTDDASPLSEPACYNTPIQDKGQLVNKQEHKDNLDDPTQRVNDQFKKTELILDEEAQEINSIPIHAPETHYHDTSYEDYDIEREVAKAINQQRQNIDKQTREQTSTMEAKWKAMAIQQQTRLTEQADFQSSIAMQENNSAREEFLQLRADVETARQTLDVVLAQTDILQETTSDRHRDLTNLIAEGKQVGTSIQRDTVIVRDLITVTKSETTKLRQAIRDSTTAPQDLEDTRSAVRKTAQHVIDSEMSKIERGTQGTLLKKREDSCRTSEERDEYPGIRNQDNHDRRFGMSMA